MIYRLGGDISCQFNTDNYYNAASSTKGNTFKLFNWNIESRFAFMNPRKLGPIALVRWDDE